MSNGGKKTIINIKLSIHQNRIEGLHPIPRKKGYSPFELSANKIQTDTRYHESTIENKRTE